MKKTSLMYYITKKILLNLKLLPEIIFKACPDPELTNT